MEEGVKFFLVSFLLGRPRTHSGGGPRKKFHMAFWGYGQFSTVGGKSVESVIHKGRSTFRILESINYS